MKHAINEQLTDTSSWVNITLPAGTPCGAFYIKALDPSTGSFDIRSSSAATTFFTVNLDMVGLGVPGKKKAVTFFVKFVAVMSLLISNVNRCDMKHRKKIHILLFISGLCKMLAKKLAGDYSGFVFAMPLPGWSFVLNRFNRQVFLSEYASKGKPILKNALEVQSWSMPQQWHDDFEGLKEKHT